jgi:putative two-component system response regulator
MNDTADKRVVLVVDDVTENIAILVEILKDAYKVRVAKDGERALKIAQASPSPDIILLDVEMPGIDGYETCRRLKSIEATRDIPVIFVTGHSDEQERAKGLALGAVDYLTKPVDPAAVQNKVAETLT